MWFCLFLSTGLPVAISGLMCMLQQVFREFNIDCILQLQCADAQHGHGHGHGHVDIAMDLHSHQDMDMDMDMGTSGKQLIRFCTWRDARLERAMP